MTNRDGTATPEPRPGIAGRVLDWLLARPRIRDAVCWRLLADSARRAVLVHALAMQGAWGDGGFDDVPLDGLQRIDGFEDCYWLFSSNELNMGLSQLHFDDAAHLYRLLRRADRPRVVELGRYKGGTTFLMAAAGARVLAIERDPEIDRRYREPLLRALRRFGLEDRVEPVLADAHAFPVETAAHDYVLLHSAPDTYGEARALAERWWPGIAPGGGLILHRSAYLPGVAALIGRLERELADWGADFDSGIPGENVILRKRMIEAATMPA